MKKTIFFGVFILTILASCEKNDRDIFLKVGADLEFRFSDIELYDTSTHIIYFKNEYPEFRNLENGSFTFYDNGEPVYTGSLWPGHSSLAPMSPFIFTPPMYGNYALQIDSWSLVQPDKREDPRIIQLLIQNNLLHSGLSISDCSVDVNETQLIFSFTISNRDQSDLYIVDPEKTGPALFHYFTNGLHIFDLANNEIFSSTIQAQEPDQWNGWEIEWLYELEAGNSKEFIITYPIDNPLPPGEYNARFVFPGLMYQVTKDQLYQENIRIWLGDVSTKKLIIIP